MKVLTVSHGFPPDEQAGAELYAQQTARGLQARGDTVTVFCPGFRPGDPAAPRPEFECVEEEVDGLRVLRMHRDFSDLRRLSDTYDDPRALAAFEAVLEREAPDLVHVHHIAGSGVPAILAARRRGIPVAVTLHDFWFQCARGQRLQPRGHVCTEIEPSRCSWCIAGKRLRYTLGHARAALGGRLAPDEPALGRWLRAPLRIGAEAWRQRGTRPIRQRTERMREALNAADLVLAPSRFLHREFADWGIAEDRLVLSEYGMDLAPWARETAATPDARPEGAPLRFGFVGSLLASKGPQLLIEAFASLPEGAATLSLHGAAPHGAAGTRFEQDLRERATHPGIRFRGRFEHRDIAAVFGSFDVLVMPSLWFENAPLTLYESALARRPAITSDLGGMKEFAEQFGTALTFPAGDRNALAAAMRRFLDEPGLRDSLSHPKRAVRSIDQDVDGLREHFARLVRSVAG